MLLSSITSVADRGCLIRLQFIGPNETEFKGKEHMPSNEPISSPVNFLCKANNFWKYALSNCK
jgi:hypothetical protein